MNDPATTSARSELAILLRQFAHDLKGHLGTTGLWFFLLDTASSDEDRARGLQGLRDTFEALNRAVTDLGDAGRALDGVAEPEPGATDVAALVAKTAAQAAEAGSHRGIVLESRLPPGPWPPVKGDQEGLARTIERLYFWALAHAANNSTLAIEVRVDGEFIRIRVPSPAGVAVPTLRERIEQIAAGERESGLALPLARETLRRHGGELEPSGDCLEARIPLSSGDGPDQTPR
jgi:signal transduction histidine kinase